MRKEVSVITILDVPNFGSMLQAYATGLLIEREGYDVEFVDYYREDHSAFSKYKIFLHDEKLGPLPKRFVIGLATLLVYSFIMKRLRRFVKSRFRFTKFYHSERAILENPPIADLYLTGSDQVWNSKHHGHIDNSFFLFYTKGKKVSFSSSVGMDCFPDNEIEKTKQYLDTYKKISVREIQTCEYLKELGYSNTEHVLDPSLMISSSEWKQIANVKPIKERYLLVYSVERNLNDFIFSQARILADELNLKVYAISATYPVRAKQNGVDKVFALGTVKEFLTLVANAEFIVASSFHGTAFALNFNKNFITITPDCFNIRMESLMNTFDISDRIVTSKRIHCNDLKPINYKAVNEMLEREREHSLKVLKETLSI